jgi:NADH:ubiquinone oxidoreductase subunit C
MEEENIFYNNHETYVKWMQSIFILNLEKMISKTVFISRINTTEIEISIQNPFIITITSIFKNHSLFLFKQLTELAVIDYPTKSNRFKINYVLSSITFNTKLILSVHVKELQPILSLVELYESAE